MTTFPPSVTGQTMRQALPNVRPDFSLLILSFSLMNHVSLMYTRLHILADFRNQFKDTLNRYSPQQRGFYSYLTSVVVRFTSTLLRFWSFVDVGVTRARFHGYAVLLCVLSHTREDAGSNSFALPILRTIARCTRT